MSHCMLHVGLNPCTLVICTGLDTEGILPNFSLFSFNTENAIRNVTIHNTRATSWRWL